ncbi:hypothetical protein SDJN03_02063, partial [Cucurbita argyrosperma subsp. sororia]
MKKLVKCFRKLKKMLVSSNGTKRKQETPASSSRRCAVFCEELFLSSKRKKCYGSVSNDVDHNPFVAARLAAQGHFSLRPNVYL